MGILYHAQRVFNPVSSLNVHSLGGHLRPNPLQVPHASIRSSRVKRTTRHHSLFLNHGMSPHAEMTSMGCQFSNATTRTPVLPYHRRFALLVVGQFPETHDQLTRISLLFSTRSITVREEDASSSKLGLSKIVRRRRRRNWLSSTRTLVATLLTSMLITTLGGYERSSPAISPHQYRILQIGKNSMLRLRKNCKRRIQQSEQRRQRGPRLQGNRTGKSRRLGDEYERLYVIYN